ncbi:MAG: hypothetical protein JNN15_16420 [Blastocatellia bacterium]|nr:hypothetical protein [Blastocatellia bacterium]
MSTRWQKVDKLVEAALDLKASERKAFLDRACFGDDDLRKEIEALIAANEQAEQNDFLGEPPVELFNNLSLPNKRSLFSKQLLQHTTVKAIKKKIEQKAIYRASLLTIVAVLLLLFVVNIISNISQHYSQQAIKSIEVQKVKKLHSLNYWAMLQRYDNRQQPKGKAIRLTSITGQTYANKGDGITLHFVSKESGYLYVFNQSIKAQEQENSNIYSVLFPTPSVNNGVAHLTSGKEVSTREGVFEEEEATERIWIIWTVREDLGLRDIIERAKQGEVIGSDMQLLDTYIETRKNQKVKTEVDYEKAMMNLIFDSEEMIYAIDITYVG